MSRHRDYEIASGKSARPDRCQKSTEPAYGPAWRREPPDASPRAGAGRMDAALDAPACERAHVDLALGQVQRELSAAASASEKTRIDDAIEKHCTGEGFMTRMQPRAGGVPRGGRHQAVEEETPERRHRRTAARVDKAEAIKTLDDAHTGIQGIAGRRGVSRRSRELPRAFGFLLSTRATNDSSAARPSG